MKTEHSLFLHGMRIYARHGVMPQEQLTGSWFTVDLDVMADLTAASLSDRLEDTVSYALLAEIVQQEMAQPSQLLEHVAGRILSRIKAIPQVTDAHIAISKEAAPIQGLNCREVGIRL